MSRDFLKITRVRLALLPGAGFFLLELILEPAALTLTHTYNLQGSWVAAEFVENYDAARRMSSKETILHVIGALALSAQEITALFHRKLQLP